MTMALIRICNNCPICLEDECNHTEKDVEVWREKRQEDERMNPRPGSDEFIGPLKKPAPYMLFIHPSLVDELKKLNIREDLIEVVEFNGGVR